MFRNPLSSSAQCARPYNSTPPPPPPHPHPPPPPPPQQLYPPPPTHTHTPPHTHTLTLSPVSENCARPHRLRSSANTSKPASRNRPRTCVWKNESLRPGIHTSAPRFPGTCVGVVVVVMNGGSEWRFPGTCVGVVVVVMRGGSEWRFPGTCVGVVVVVMSGGNESGSEWW
jgi:hypothetical protein